MLLRRMTEHVKAQNWFAVGLDFVIVVAGVFVGLQVSNWNSLRSDAETEKHLIVGLENDLRGMLASFKTDDETALRAHEGWIYAFRALERCEANPEHQDAINFSLSKYQSAFALQIQRSAFDEMQATGAFSRLADLDLKNDVATLYAKLDAEKNAQLGGRDNQLAAGRIMWKNIAFSFLDDDPYTENFDTWGTAAFDPLTHCDNLELRGAIWEMVDVNRDWLSSSAYYVSKIESILSELAETQE